MVMLLIISKLAGYEAYGWVTRPRVGEGGSPSRSTTLREHRTEVVDDLCPVIYIMEPQFNTELHSCFDCQYNIFISGKNWITDQLILARFLRLPSNVNLFRLSQPINQPMFHSNHFHAEQLYNISYTSHCFPISVKSKKMC